MNGLRPPPLTFILHPPPTNPPSSEVSTLVFRAFLAQTLVVVSLDVSPVSNVSPYIVYTQDLAFIFIGSGHLTCTATLAILTVDNCSYSHSCSVVG
ncbi:hypothetical protein BDM02DRAFT_3122414 [Thelephora ganbajun]|uniref:Uncharacterized protein n=1 Tax=Thelephora ganbajun TaxID=370292 RepID=A0ACB6Z3H1_THEGA|nr:hypothetical protein BDM02DRAFT_3122414 [Thelephora ganbajun]